MPSYGTAPIGWNAKVIRPAPSNADSGVPATGLEGAGIRGPPEGSDRTGVTESTTQAEAGARSAINAAMRDDRTMTRTLGMGPPGGQ